MRTQATHPQVRLLDDWQWPETDVEHAALMLALINGHNVDGEITRKFGVLKVYCRGCHHTLDANLRVLRCRGA